MGNLKTLLESRFKKSPREKMDTLTRQRMDGELSPLLSRFSTLKLSPQEEEKFRQLLENYTRDSQVSEEDFHNLCWISAQIKQIHHQAILLHGERIKKVRDLLKNYREGAFSSWLLLTYGNRQTPYNFLVYYELFTTLPESLKTEAEKMPRQAIYTLAARQGPQEKKEAIIRNYRGESKGELLDIIRKEFPLVATDRRQTCLAKQAFSLLSKSIQLLKKCPELSSEDCLDLDKLIKKIQKIKNSFSSNTKV